MALRIYYNTQSNHIVFRPSLVEPQPTFNLHAYATDDGGIDIMAMYTDSRLEVANYAWADILDIDGNPAGVDLASTVNYLNSQFEWSGGGSTGLPPVITSTLTVSVLEGDAFRYAIVASNAPTLYLASGLPAGLACNPVSGEITGVTDVVGVYNIFITATNAYGADTETLVLTVILDVGGYSNTYSIRFRDHVYQHHLTVKTSAAINDGSNDSWSISAWLNLDAGVDSDLFSQGTTTDSRYIYLDASGRVVLKFTKSGKYRTYRTDTSLAVGSWTHVVVTYSSAPACVVYFDGIAQAMTLVINNLAANTTNHQNMRIGRGPGASADALWLDGYIDEWAYWDKSLSALEVTTLYNAGVPQDLSLLGFVGNLKQWLLMGDGDAFPLLSDNAVGGVHDATMTNMTALNIVNYTP